MMKTKNDIMSLGILELSYSDRWLQLFDARYKKEPSKEPEEPSDQQSEEDAGEKLEETIMIYNAITTNDNQARWADLYRQKRVTVSEDQKVVPISNNDILPHQKSRGPCMKFLLEPKHWLFKFLSTKSS